MANKHTTGAGLVFFVCVFISKVTPKCAAIWFPAHAAQIQATEEVFSEAIKDFAVGYGLIMGADAKKKTGNLDTPTNGDNASTIQKIGLVLGFAGLAFTIQRLI